MGNALWLVPKNYTTFNESVSSLIISLQTLFDDAPIFDPHITITSGITVETSRDVSVILNSALAAINSIKQINQQRHEQVKTPNVSHFNDSTSASTSKTSLNLQFSSDNGSPSRADTPEQSHEKNSNALSSDLNFSDYLIMFDKLVFGKKYFQKVYVLAYPNPDLLSFARIIRELFVELPSLKRRLADQEQKHENTLQRSGSKKAKGRVRSLSIRSNNNGNINHGDSNPENASTVPKTVLNPNDLPTLAMQAAEDWSISEFKPHMSLVYSSTYSINSALERTIKTRIEDLLNVAIDHKNRIIDVNQNLAWPPDGSLKLVQCEGDIKDWKVLGSVDYHLSS